MKRATYLLPPKRNSRLDRAVMVWGMLRVVDVDVDVDGVELISWVGGRDRGYSRVR